VLQKDSRRFSNLTETRKGNKQIKKLSGKNKMKEELKLKMKRAYEEYLKV
jgi:hypothetical protein